MSKNLGGPHVPWGFEIPFASSVVGHESPPNRCACQRLFNSVAVHTQMSGVVLHMAQAPAQALDASFDTSSALATQTQTLLTCQPGGSMWVCV